MASSGEKCSFCHHDMSLPQKGWHLRDPTHAKLCVPCLDGLSTDYTDGTFCHKYHEFDDGWRKCDECEKQVHCGCIMALHLFETNDTCGVTCKKCLEKKSIAVSIIGASSSAQDCSELDDSALESVIGEIGTAVGDHSTGIAFSDPTIGNAHATADPAIGDAPAAADAAIGDAPATADPAIGDAPAAEDLTIGDAFVAPPAIKDASVDLPAIKDTSVDLPAIKDAPDPAIGDAYVEPTIGDASADPAIGNADFPVIVVGDAAADSPANGVRDSPAAADPIIDPPAAADPPVIEDALASAGPTIRISPAGRVIGEATDPADPDIENASADPLIGGSADAPELGPE